LQNKRKKSKTLAVQRIAKRNKNPALDVGFFICFWNVFCGIIII